MRCPYCDVDNSKTVDSRPVDGARATRRRIECVCGKRFTTYERIEGDNDVETRLRGAFKLIEVNMSQLLDQFESMRELLEEMRRQREQDALDLNPHTKMSKADRDDLRREFVSGMSRAVLAKKWNITVALVSKIINEVDEEELPLPDQ